MRHPPRLARRLLERILRGPTAAYLMGDLEERFRHLARSSPLRARIWYWRQALVAVLLPVPGPVGAAPGGGFRAFRDDLGRAARTLRRRPLEAVSAILPLGLGIGVVATAFSILWGTVVAGLPFHESDRLVHFERARPAAGESSLAVTPHDYLDWRASQRSFEDLGAYVERAVAFPTQGGPPERHVGVAISANAFPLLRVEAALGRTFTEEETRPSAPPVLILSHGLWMSRFGGDPTIVGRNVIADGRPVTVVGVMPEGFGFPIAEELWLPLRLDTSTLERGQGRLDVFGRLRAGQSLATARAEFQGITARLADAHPATNAGITASLRSFQEEYVGEDFIHTVYRILFGAALVLFVCCANVANLLLIRGLRRRQDLAVRRALGATSGALVRQLVVEALYLSAGAAAVGVALAWYGVAWFNRVGTGVGVFALPHGSDSLFWWDVGLNGPTLGAVLLTATLTVVLSGVVPALRVAGASSLTRGAGGSGPGVQRLQRGIVVGQIALTAGLLVAAGFVVRSVANVDGVAHRLADEGVVVLRLSLPSAADDGSESYADLEARLGFLDDLERTLTADPSIAVAAFGARVPLETPRFVPFRIDGETEPTYDEAREAGVVTVSSSFFDVVDIEPVAGRLLSPSDRAGARPVALVNETFARRYLAAGDAVGSSLRLGSPDAEEPWVEVVGVVPDLWERPGDPAEEAGVYMPLGQLQDGDPRVRTGPWGLAYPTIAVREARPGAVDAGLLGGHVFAMDPTLPIRSVETMATVAERRLGRYRVWGRFWMAFAVSALLLAGLGIYGVLSFAVTSRISEIGIRRALGASAAAVRRTVVSRALVDVIIGGAAGLWLGRLLTRGLQQVLYGVDPGDPWVLVGVGSLILTVGVVASWWPARRAAGIDPRDAMRAE